MRVQITPRTSKWIALALVLSLAGGIGAYILTHRPAASPAAPRQEIAAAPGKSATGLQPRIVPPPQQGEKVFSVDQFGRYAVKLASQQGAALQIIDRMAGPSEQDGVVGQRNGRVDLFLGVGEHKVKMTFAAGEKTTPEMSVQPFQELNRGKLPQLVALSLVQADLGDLQQRSYWMTIPSRQTVFIEAAGRHLADLRLWKDGTWLVDAEPTESDSELKPGEPLAVRQLVADLNPGVYLLTAYGGVGETWTQTSDDNPFVLRWGVPSLSESGRRQFTAGPFGFDRWKVPDSANYFRLELPQGEQGQIEVGEFSDGQIIGASRAAIDKKSRAATAELTMQSSFGKQKIVTVTRRPGEHYVLQQYRALPEYTFNAEDNAEFLVGTLRPGHDEDDVDLTSILTDASDNDHVIASRTLKLSQTVPWRRRFNLLDPASLFVEITEPGRYRAKATGIDADLSWTPFIQRDGVPGLIGNKASPWTWETSEIVRDLDAGFYVLRVRPHSANRGILTLSLSGEKSAEASEDSPPLLGASFAPVPLLPKRNYRLAMNAVPGPGFGAVVRRLPADLTDDLPLVLSPGERRSIPVTAISAGTLQAITDDNAVFPLKADDGASTEKAKLPAGRHTVEITNGNTAPAIVSLHFTLDAPPTPRPLSAMSDADLKKIPVFPTLETGTPQFLDLATRQSATFTVKVKTPALYSVETHGLLQTSGTLRTQVLPALAKASANGVGRNMLLQHYLREGVYQLTVATEGATAGHLGVSLSASPVRSAGDLALETPAHAAAAAGEGLLYDFNVAKPGSYHIRAVTLARPSSVRLEDADGWPLTRPEQTGDFTIDLSPGHYRLVVIPQPLPCRVLTLIEENKAAEATAGHGPHPLPLEGTVANRWDEPADGAERVPDVWTFEVPAGVDSTVSLSDMMEGEIKRDSDGASLATLTFRSPWSGHLEPGLYRLEVRSVRPNNRFDYSVTTSTKQLAAGSERDVSVPSRIPVALGGDQLIEISSFGLSEVRASLLDESGKLVARSDSQPEDWNFKISARVAPGSYVLKVDPLAAGSGQTTRLRIRQLAEVTDMPMASSGSREIGDGVLHVIPLDLKANEGPLLVAAASSRDAIGLMLERRAGDGPWLTVASASGHPAYTAFPRDPAEKAAYRLRLWSLDHSAAPMSLMVRTVTPSFASESGLADGVALSPVADVKPGLGIAAVKLEKPGLFRLESYTDAVQWSTASAGRALAHGQTPMIIAGDNRLWFLDELASGRVKAKRVSFDGRDPVSLTLSEDESAILPLVSESGGPRLWVVESRLGQPGIGVGPLGKSQDARTSAFAPGVAAALLPDAGDARNSTLRVWHADGPGELPVTVTQYSFAKASHETLALGDSDHGAGAHAATEFALPGGLKRVRIVLPANTAAAFLDKNGAVERLLWSAGQPVSETLDSAAEKLLLLNEAKDSAQWSISLTSTQDKSKGLVVTRDAVLRLSAPAAGLSRIEVSVGEKMTLHLSGPVEDALVLQADGTQKRGMDTLELTDSAVLMVKHTPGTVLAWLDNGATPESLSQAKDAPLQQVPATVSLSGGEVVWRFSMKQPTLLHVMAETPVMADSVIPGLPSATTIWPHGANLQLFVPGGGERLLGLRPLQDSVLSGLARISSSDAVPITEGLGPKLRLAPGDARLYVFSLKEAGPIGIGVRGEADTARVRLLTETGEVLSEGVITMTDLPAGRYFLLVENRSDGAATELQPALVGAVKPGHTPPEDIKRMYWTLLTEEDGK